MKIKTIVLFVGICMLAILLNSCISDKNKRIQIKPKDQKVTHEKIENNKIVYIENVNPEEIKKAIQQFCDSYNQESLKALPLLSLISGNKFVVTFPYDIDFETYCYFVNYLYYPNDIFYKPIIYAWATTKPNDVWMKDDIVNKKVMLYIPNDDKDHDNVYLTTSDNIGYKLGFSLGESSQKLDDPKKRYSEPIKQDKLIIKESIQYK